MNHLCIQHGYSEKNVFVMDNGVVLNIQNGKVVNSNEKISSGDVLVDGILDGDLSDIVLRDRELLSQDGVLLIIANIDARKKSVVTTPEIVSRGFIFMKENEELIKEVENIFYKVSDKIMVGKYIDWRVFREALRDDISKHLYKVTKRRPIIIPVLIDTQTVE